MELTHIPVKLDLMLPTKNIGELFAYIVEKYGPSLAILSAVAYIFFSLYIQDSTALKSELKTQINVLEKRVEDQNQHIREMQAERVQLIRENSDLRARILVLQAEVERLKHR